MTGLRLLNPTPTLAHVEGVKSRCAWLLVLLCIALVGCKKQQETKPKETAQSAVPRPLRVAIVDDPALAAIVQRQWKARTEGELSLVELTEPELQEAKSLEADVIIYPSAWLGTLAERKLIGPLSEDTLSNPQLDQRGTFDLQRVKEVRWGDEAYAVTFGSPQFVLMYRSDLFAKHQLTPPKTWHDYETLLAQLTRESLGDSAPDDDQPWSAVAEPWGPIWASRVLLARSAAYARHPSQYSVLFELRTGEPLIAGEPFQQALTEMANVTKFNVTSPFELTPDAAKAALVSGQTAMAWCWATNASSQKPDAALPNDAAFAFAELPGGLRVYNYAEKIWDSRTNEESQRVPLLAVAGRLGSVTREARYPKDAANMLCWLSGKQWGVQIAPASQATTLYRQVHVNQPARWVDPFLTEEAAAQYAELVALTQSRGVCLLMPRIPGWMQYLSDLDQSIKAVVNGQPAKAALEQTAERWREITNQLGVEQQQAAFYRDLGLEP
jgi:ABC-type glycerol-3-phosphate transport system substrate-binding protein